MKDNVGWVRLLCRDHLTWGISGSMVAGVPMLH
jgi:hypothetical protein